MTDLYNLLTSTGTAFLLICLALVLWLAFYLYCTLTRQEVYRGPASAMCNNMPHYSAGTRTVFIVPPDRIPGIELGQLLAEVPIEQHERMFGRNKLAIVPVTISVCNGPWYGVSTEIV